MNVDILYSPQLTQVDTLLDRVRKALFDTALIAEIKVVEIKSDQEANQHQFLGSPTIRVDGIDVEANMTFGKSNFGVRKRLYRDADKDVDMPSRKMIEDTLEVGHLAEMDMMGHCC